MILEGYYLYLNVNGLYGSLESPAAWCSALSHLDLDALARRTDNCANESRFASHKKPGRTRVEIPSFAVASSIVVRQDFFPYRKHISELDIR